MNEQPKADDLALMLDYLDGKLSDEDMIDFEQRLAADDELAGEFDSMAGVDLLRSDRGPLVMEVNSSPGLEGIEEATGVDVAGEIIEFVESHADPED